MTGLRSMSRVSARIGVGIVALKKSVCRLAGRWRRIFRISGRKPMSSIRSASSSTRISSPGELGVGMGEVIQQPAGGRDDDVRAAPEGVLLRAHADAAEHGRRGDRGVHREIVEVLHDLRGQLAGRGEDERPGGAARLVDQPVEDRQDEGRGLAAAGHGAGEDVPAGEGGRNRVGLDRRGAGEAELFDALEEIGVELQRGKGQVRVRSSGPLSHLEVCRDRVVRQGG